nr:MAG TPA: Rho termination factor, N-terminal domain [Caudoviricetes sp.]
MITDEQGREWLLQKLYDDGWRYIVADKYDNMYLTNEKPSMFDDVDEVRISSCKKYIGVTGVMAALPKLSANEVYDIAEKLGIVDWSKVKVDTPILVSGDGKTWYKRYFALFDKGKVFAWEYGATSWSIDSDDEVFLWNYAKLAEV